MRRPRITKPHLVWKKDRKGVWFPSYVRRWTVDGKRRSKAIVLQWEGDPEKLDELYWKAHGGRHEAQTRTAKYTWGELVNDTENQRASGFSQLMKPNTPETKKERLQHG